MVFVNKIRLKINYINKKSYWKRRNRIL